MGQKDSQEKPIDIRIARREDIEGIFYLQQINLYRNLSEEEREKGFVSAETPVELLEEIVEQEGITTAFDDNKVVGYLMPVSREHAGRISIFRSFLEKLETTYFESRPLNEQRYFILGQVCIDKDYRGKGILQRLHDELIERFVDKYDFAVTEIDAGNKRSLHANATKVGWKVIDKYHSDGRDWNIVILDIRPKRKIEMKGGERR